MQKIIEGLENEVNFYKSNIIAHKAEIKELQVRMDDEENFVDALLAVLRQLKEYAAKGETEKSENQT